jgi:hypothetical protein
MPRRRQQEVPAAACRIEHGQSKERRFPFGRCAAWRKTRPQRWLQRVLHERRHQLRRGVVRPGGAPFGAARGEGNDGNRAAPGDGRVQFEETFVHRPQFFGVERRIIDAARRIAIPGKMADGAQQVAVGDHGSVEIDGRKQVAVERRRAQQRGQRRIAHDLAQRLKPQPEVDVIGEGAAARQESPQPPDAIVRVVRVVADQPAIFGGQQEEHAVDDAQHLAIQRSGNVVRDGFARRRETERGAQRHVRRVRQEAVRQDQQSLFHAVAQAVAHPSALFQRVLMVAFQPAVARVSSGVRQARAVDQPVERGEVGEALLIEDLRQVAFDIRLPPEVRAVAPAGAACARW